MIPVRPLGRTGLSVSEICLGSGQMTWSCPPARAKTLLDRYTALGGNFLDTADIYTQWMDGHRGGESETLLGEWMAARKNRNALVIASKCRGRMWAGPDGEGLSRAHLLKACDDSLRRLRTDRIDLYQMHWADPATPIEETLAAAGDLVKAGKIRAFGLSNYSGGQFAEAVVTAARGPYPKVACYQPYYNLMDRGLEKDHVAVMKTYGVGCIPYTPIGQGFLSGKYRPNRPLPETSRANHVKKTYFSDKNFRILGTLERLGKKRGKTIVQVALGWHLSHEWVTAPIIGPNTVDQLNENLGAAGLRLSPDEMKALDEVSG